eukprot:scaffold115659_cov62-Phaeocystis_antarctica.AAC.1
MSHRFRKVFRSSPRIRSHIPDPRKKPWVPTHRPGGYLWVLNCHRFKSFVTSSTGSPVKTTESDLALRATERPPSRTPLSQSASALLDVKASNQPSRQSPPKLCCAEARLTIIHLAAARGGHLGFMLHACRAWLHRQVSLLVSRLGRFSSTASRAMSQV